MCVFVSCVVLSFSCRDLKPENILLTSRDSSAQLKLIDFGTSEFCKPGQRLTKKFGTPYYVAPEVRTVTHAWCVCVSVGTWRVSHTRAEAPPCLCLCWWRHERLRCNGRGVTVGWCCVRVFHHPACRLGVCVLRGREALLHTPIKTRQHTAMLTVLRLLLLRCS